ncbi:mannose-1-phosphate guanylyltransferase [Lignipirellula cremea]|uniref:mannose-1-phosphate guanylyltransferase n=1 Tax=Lignipirellula cremea TaxID=2528010 RepID=A0A518E0J4_9BACT|nr:mannose-1-phosphate guanylyltransferase [Lignipirellula cremea]QDU97603.1 Mannose-1-phosphate guanylyltransferase [Lignipirellula cremea]
MLHAIIMAGGAGTRFWPASTKDLPKQLLDLASQRTMIQETCDRLGDLVPANRTFIVTNQRLVEGIAAQLPDLPAGSIVGEPCKRDTAPCVGLAAALVAHQDPDGVMVVMPADHVIRPSSKFRSAIEFAAGLVEEAPERIVTFGIRPTYPAATYGYIERGAPLPDQGEYKTFQINQFREKPSVEVAEEYLQRGGFYWNAGIFLWKASTILQALEKFEPKMFGHIQTIAQAIGTDAFAEVLEREFAAIEGKSIDYAVMERHENRLVVEAPFEWDDVGNWSSLARLNEPDENGNIVIGRHVGVDTAGSIIRSSGQHLVATLGMQDCIIVHTPTATMVANRKDEESVRKLVEMIGERGWHEYL